MTGSLTRAARAAVLALSLLVVPLAAAAQEGPAAFEVEQLNAGLGAPPETVDRSTPRATVQSFLTLTSRGQHAAAAHLLDVGTVPPAEQAEAGPRLARQFAEVFERKVPLDFDSIPDRPDGMDVTGTDREPMVGVARKSIELGSLELGPWPVSVRIARVAPGGGEPVWVFARQTVEAIPVLHAAFGPTALERALPDTLRAEAIGGILWWELLAVPLLVLLSVALAAAAWTLLGLVAARTPHEAVSAAIRRSRLPAVLIVVAVTIHVVTSQLFVFTARAETTLSLLFWATVVLALVFAASRVLDTLIDFASNRYLETIDDPANSDARRWYTNLSAVKRLGVIAVIVGGLAFALSSLELFSSFGMSLLVSAGIATAIFGLAAQTVLGNILASLQLALAKPIRIGDAVYYDNHWAYVEQINYTFVQLRTWDQKRFIVPVKHFVSNPFENWTKEDPEMIMPVLLKLDHRADVESLRREFRRMAEQDPDWSGSMDPKVQVIGQDEDGIDVRFYCSASNPTAAWNLHCRVREHMVAFLRELDEPSDLPLTRLAVVADTRGGGTAAPRTNEEGVRETGEPRARPLRPDRAEAAE